MRYLALALAVCACGKPAAGRDGGKDVPNPDASTPTRLVAYVGGYGPDIGRADVSSTGTLGPLVTIPAFAASPSFLAVSPDATALYAVSEGTSRVGAYRIDPATAALTFVNDVSAGGTGPAHVSVDRSGKFVLVANYNDGTVSVLPAGTDGSLGAPQQTLNLGANAHMIVTDPSNRYALVPCLGSDYVAQLHFDATTGTLSANSVPHFTTAANAGPRHLAFAPDGKHVYLINEKASTISALAFDDATGQLAELQTVSTRASGATGANTTAEIWVHPAGGFVFGSNRGDDNIVTFAIDSSTGKLALVGHTPTGGQTPRDFTLDPAGSMLYVANQASNTIASFTVDAAGTLSPMGSPVTATSPAFIGLVALPK